MNWTLPNNEKLSAADRDKLDELFPEIATSIRAFGSNILVQDMVEAETTKGGIIKPNFTRDQDAHVQTVARVLSIGPEAPMITLGDRVREGWDLQPGQLVKLSGLSPTREVKQDEGRTRFVKPTEILGVVEDPREVLR